VDNNFLKTNVPFILAKRMDILQEAFTWISNSSKKVLLLIERELGQFPWCEGRLAVKNLGSGDGKLSLISTPYRGAERVLLVLFLLFEAE